MGSSSSADDAPVHLSKNENTQPPPSAQDLSRAFQRVASRSGRAGLGFLVLLCQSVFLPGQEYSIFCCYVKCFSYFISGTPGHGFGASGRGQPAGGAGGGPGFLVARGWGLVAVRAGPRPRIGCSAVMASRRTKPSFRASPRLLLDTAVNSLEMESVSSCPLVNCRGLAQIMTEDD